MTGKCFSKTVLLATSLWHRFSHTALTVQLLAAFFACFIVIDTVQGKESIQVAGQDNDLEKAAHLIVMVSGQLAGAPTSGAGILFGQEDGRIYIATANHVVRRGSFSAESLNVRFRSHPDNPIAAELLPHADRDLDLAVLRVETQTIPLGTIPFRRLGEPTALNRGDAVYHVGYPEGRPWRANVTQDRFAERAGDALYFESSSVRAGDSGGGLFNARWELVGMVRADQPPEGAAIRMENIVEKLRQWGYPIKLRYTLFASTKISFLSDHDGDLEIYTANIDGTQRIRLARHVNMPQIPLTSYAPKWSPDGTKIAFVSGRDGNHEIYVMNTDGTNPINLSRDPADDHSPAWSPDGKKIAFQSSRGTKPAGIYAKDEIYVTNVDGTNAVNITNNPEHDGSPGWSPDVTRIAFESYRDGNREIYVINADGTGIVNLTKSPDHDSRPAWSPDGKKIAFESSRESNLYSQAIFVMNADGSNPVNLTHEPAEYSGICWSPDGTKIAFASTRNNISWDIYVMNADGTGLVNLTDHAGADLLPSWSPDGMKIAFMSNRDGADRIYVMDIDGGNLTCLTSDLANAFAPSWSPFLKK